MKKGVILFAYNTEDYDYVKMAEYAVKRIHYFLDLPVTLVTGNRQYQNNLFDKVIYEEANTNNKKDRKVWFNKDRYKAFDLSPYDNTLILDVDYVVNSQKLNKLFQIMDDICVHNTTEFLMQPNLPYEYLSAYSYKTAWATVIGFKKTNKAKQVFDCMKMIQENYNHYSNVYNFVAGTFRNDYAISIALHIVNGHLLPKSDIIPWNLIHVGKNTSVYKTNDNVLCEEFVVIFDNWKKNKIKKEYIQFKNLDFHVINKDNFVELLP